MSEQWKKWEPMSGLPVKYYVDSIVNNLETLEILLSDAANRNDKIRIVFENCSDAYRKTKRDVQEHALESFQKESNECGFFKITNSAYQQWLSEQSCTFADYMCWQHFCFKGLNFIVDVIVAQEPQIEFIGE
ncbi:hypothetical protein IPF37_02290 [bacterium]|nr:MAG: hypothetical protein IPF37_02290 [bacterium]